MEFPPKRLKTYFSQVPFPAVTNNAVSNNAITKVAHFDSKATVEEHIRALAIPATFLHLSVFMSLIPSWLTRTSAPHKPAAYTISLPIALTTRIPLISAASSTGVYVKSLLTHREKVLGRQISAAQEWYLLEEIVEIVREEAGLDVVFRRCSGEEYVAGLAVGGMPKFFQGAILENMRWSEEWGFFAEKIRDVYTGHEVSRQRISVLEKLDADWMVDSFLESR